MTQLFEQAMAEVAKRPAMVQDAIATLVLDELRDNAHWQEVFDHTSDAQWDAMVQQVLAEIDNGRTEPLASIIDDSSH
ncbi:hypothetical protein [Thiorhodovibrio frisius]|uniref:Uncharacterized protein n=1 Tax=Thiorhodovibrio frisius TaxID=631362 RepID=H8Z091_9GAMM|nr:hypothetical protein [Thiorhodovibrio frisius]EIC22299.1 hypothetical protein Thi970DRAFT_02552 [Thiorhodovibrio frisius]WPL24593.1 hypothetical protein Thiofri_04813 [Thiorhodovibrio frisius]